MHKIYQPQVIKATKELIIVLEESNFFKDYNIKNYEFAEEFISDFFTQKFIDGELDLTDLTFDEDEFGEILNAIIVASCVDEWKLKGIVDSFIDENNEDRFFLTSKGKEYVKNLENNNLI